MFGEKAGGVAYHPASLADLANPSLPHPERLRTRSTIVQGGRQH